MTEKKEEKQDKAKQDEKIPQKDVNDSNEVDQNQAEVNTEQTAPEEKVELLEEKEGAGLTLEFFSKEDMLKQLKELKLDVEKKEEQIKELNQWKDKYMRLQAEFENAQKRWEKNRQYLQSQYTASALKNFLPLYDSFKKAIENTTEDEKIKQFYNQFMGILKFLGAEPMDTNINDPFDYSKHEAVTSIEKKDVEENHILDIIQEGWKFNNDVLRYAKVVISKKPKPPEKKPETKPEAEIATENESEAAAMGEEESKEKIKEEKTPKNQKNEDSEKNEYIS